MPGVQRNTSSMKFTVCLISYSFSLFALHTVTCKLQCVGGYFVTRVTCHVA